MEKKENSREKDDRSMKKGDHNKVACLLEHKFEQGIQKYNDHYYGIIRRVSISKGQFNQVFLIPRCSLRVEWE